MPNTSSETVNLSQIPDQNPCPKILFANKSGKDNPSNALISQTQACLFSNRDAWFVSTIEIIGYAIIKDVKSFESLEQAQIGFKQACDKLELKVVDN